MGLGLPDGIVRVVDYDESWPASFAIERGIIESALDGMGCVVEHIGSTSVPGLPAKPIVDIAIGTQAGSEEACVGRLQGAGYEYRGYNPKGGHVFVRRASGVRTHHLHVVAVDGDEWSLYLAFRDVLRSNAAAREAYASVKRDLATRFADDRQGYLDGKDEIVAMLLKGHSAGLAGSS